MKSSNHRVSRELADNITPVYDPNKRAQDIPDKHKRIAVRLRHSSVITNVDAAYVFGLSPSTIYRWAKDPRYCADVKNM